MTVAWGWAQARKRFYCDTGGNQTLDEYLTSAQEKTKKHFAVLDGRMVSLITVRLITDGDFEVHVTSCRGVSPQTVTEALEKVRNSLFHVMDAQVIRTSCPLYGKHEHKGSRRLAETCGMATTGVEWQSVNDDGVLWREYAITRDQFYGRRTKNNNNQ